MNIKEKYNELKTSSTLQSFLEASKLRYLWSIKGEIGITALVVMAFFKFASWLRSIDSTTGSLDPSILQFLILAAVGVGVATVFAFTVIHFAWRDVDDYIDDEEKGFKADWKKLTPKSRVATTISLFALFFIGFIIALAAAF